MAKKPEVVRVGNVSWTREEWDRMLADAEETGAEYAARWPAVVSVRYDALTKRIVLELSTGVEIGVPCDKLEGVAGTSDARRIKLKILGPGYAIQFVTLDQAFTVEELLTGCFGTKRWMAQLNRTGVRTKPRMKRSAASPNGRQSGRSRKPAIASL